MIDARYGLRGPPLQPKPPPPPTWDLDAICFARQAAVIRAPGKRKVLRCSRRAGKSRTFAAALLDAVRKPPYTNVFYLAPTFKRAKRILWSVLKELNRKYELGGIANETEAKLTFPDLGPDVNLYLGGVKDHGEADKVRGIPGKLWICDEAQDYREDVFAYALREAIEPGMLDYDGEMWVGGTPGPTRTGYFYQIDAGDKREGWEHFSWTWRENTMLPRMQMASVDDIEAALLEQFALHRDDPTWLREWCGQWVDDLNVLVLQYDRTRNACAWQTEPLPNWLYVIGFDIGIVDSDAIVTEAWQSGSRSTNIVAEAARAGQDVTDLAEAVGAAIELWKPEKVAGDLGALGKKIGEEMRRRHDLAFEAADKARKNEAIAIMNAALRKGEFFAPPDSIFAHDALKLQWDLNARAKGIRKISERYHSDVIDAALYGYKIARSFLETPRQVGPLSMIDDKRARIREEIAEVEAKRERENDGDVDIEEHLARV